MTAYPSESKGHTGWKSRKAKYLWRESSRVSCSGKETLLSVSRYDGVTPAKEESRSESLKGYKVVERGDLVINIMLAWMGALGVSDYDGIVSPAYAVYKPIVTMLPKFLHYLYRTPEYLAEFAKRSTGVVPSRWRMYGDDFGQVLTWLPPLPEQEAIVAYLDSATAKIDQAIASEERTIDLLQERKQIIIHQAVTRGLAPNTPLKLSGIPWLPQIPEKWKVWRLKYLCTMHAGKNLKSEDITPTGEYPVYGANGLRGYFGKHNENGEYLLVGRQGALCGNIHVAWRKFWATDHALVTKLAGGLNFRFAFFLFQAMNFNQYASQTAAQPGLAASALLQLQTCIPPLPEQQAIVAHLDAATAKIDHAIEVKRRQIELLRERREIIIDAAVTGKAKVS